MSRQWSILIKPPVLNANKKLHWAVRMKAVAELRARAAWLAVAARIPPLQQADIAVVVHPGKGVGRFDPQNWSSTAKAAIDGIVDAAVLPDDSSEHLLSLTYIAGDRWAKTGVELVIRSR